MAGRIAVTGASGFLGRHLLRSAEGFEVVAVVRSAEAERAVAALGARPARIEGFDVAALAAAFAGAETVVHLAQIGSEKPGASFAAINVEGTRRVVEAAQRAGVGRIVYLSGLGVARYGRTPRVTNGYFRSKLLSEAAVFGSGMEAIVLRPSWIVGPGSGLVPRLVSELKRGETEWPGDGGYRLQPLDVRDAVAAVRAGLELRTPRHVVFELVGPEPVAYRELVARLARILGVRYAVRTVTVEEAERRAASGGYRGMPKDELDCLLCDEVADVRRLESLLGRFLTPLDEALETAVRALRA